MLNNFGESLPRFALMIFQIFNLLGAVGWAAFIIYLVKISKLIKGNTKLISQINDERMSLIRLRAMSYGFMITLGATSLFFGASTLTDALTENFEFGGSFVAQSIMLIAVTSVMISYLILEKEE